MSTRHTTEPFYTQLGSRLRDIRVDRGMTLRQVAEQVQVSASAITYYEQGANRIRVLELLQLCEVYGVSAGAVLAELVADEPALVAPGQPESQSQKMRAGMAGR